MSPRVERIARSCLEKRTARCARDSLKRDKSGANSRDLTQCSYGIPSVSPSQSPVSFDSSLKHRRISRSDERATRRGSMTKISSSSSNQLRFASTVRRFVPIARHPHDSLRSLPAFGSCSFFMFLATATKLRRRDTGHGIQKEKGDATREGESYGTGCATVEQ